MIIKILYFFSSENGQEYYPGYQGYNDFFPGQDGGPGNMNFLPPTSQGTPPLNLDQPMHHSGKIRNLNILGITSMSEHS